MPSKNMPAPIKARIRRCGLPNDRRSSRSPADRPTPCSAVMFPPERFVCFPALADPSGGKRSGRNEMPLAWQGDRRALQVAPLRRLKVVAPVQQEPVVPHHDVSDLPAMTVDEPRLGREGRYFGK